MKLEKFSTEGSNLLCRYSLKPSFQLKRTSKDKKYHLDNDFLGILLKLLLQLKVNNSQVPPNLLGERAFVKSPIKLAAGVPIAVGKRGRIKRKQCRNQSVMEMYR